ncbi:MAG: hypothetical protein JNK10_07600 [Cyclobacteriaceae bacterium]|nr:hypothetical protein [Cyclobacteriaceae bacterium]
MASTTQDQVVLLLTIGTLGILTLIGFIVFFFFLYQRKIFILQQEKRRKEQAFEREMVNAQLESQEKERAHIAAELHDSVGSMLWGAKVNAAFIERSTSFTGQTQESYRELTSILDQSIDSIRRISRELLPEAFHVAGLSQSVAKLCERFNAGNGANVIFKENQIQFWNEPEALQVYRIVQELLTNAIRHSEANTIEVALNWESKLLRLCVSDNGIGFDPEAKAYGVGWWSIRQRVDYLKAELQLGKPAAENGTLICITLAYRHD